MFSLDLLADLPEPRDDEPSSLRADIADELADHLQCAFRREVLKDGDAAAARRRALDRFGDPKQLARRLWRQAMWSRIMRQRIVSGLQWMVAVTAMLISGAVFWQQSELLAELRHARQEDAAERQALTAKLDRLELPTATAGAPVAQSSEPIPWSPDDSSAAQAESEPAAPGAYASMPQSEMESPPGPSEYGQLPHSEDGPVVLTLSFVQETADGPPVSPQSVSLTSSDGGEHIEERSSLIAMNTNVPPRIEYPNGSTEPGAEGVDRIKSVFRSLEPDLYQLRIELADGQWSERLLSIRDEKPQELTIVCPAPRTKKAPVLMSIKPLPDWMQKKRLRIEVGVWAAPIEIGRAKWATASQPTQSIMFDAETGLPVALAAMTTRAAPVLDLRALPAEERRVFLPVGAVAYRFEVHSQPDGFNPVPVYQWPMSPGAEDGLRHIVQANENTWELELPQEFLNNVLSNVGGSEPAPDYGASSDPAYGAPSNPLPDAAPEPAQELSVVLARLQGVWTPVASPGGVSDADAEEGAITIAGDTATRGDGKVKCKIAVNGDKAPWWVDIGSSALLSIYNLNDSPAEVPLEGIVRLEGDTLTMCLAPSGQRPMKFDEAGLPVFVFKRKAQP